MNITVFNQQRDLSISLSTVKELVSCLFTSLNIISDEIVIHLITDSKMKALHDTFFDDPSSTDCISFPLDAPNIKKSTPTILGEVFICPKVGISYAMEHHLDPYEEVSRYLVHGILHLIGYDDLEPTAKKKMRRKENQCLKLLASQGKLLSKKSHPRYV